MKKPVSNILRPGTVDGLASSQAGRPGFKPSPRIKKDRRAGAAGQTNMTLLMALSTHAALRELAATRGISMQQLVASWVDKGLAEAGEAPFKFRDE